MKSKQGQDLIESTFLVPLAVSSSDVNLLLSYVIYVDLPKGIAARKCPHIVV